MQPFSAPGMFWDASTPDRQVPGRVDFSADGVRLTVFEALRAFEMPADEVASGGWHRREVPVLHGRTHDGQDVSLLAAAALVMEGPFDRVEEEYRCEFGLLGGHVANPAFETIYIEFDVLKAWVHPDPPARSTGSRTYELSLCSETIASCTLPLGELELITQNEGKVGDRVALERVVLLKLSAVPGQSLDTLIEQVVRRLQDMLITVVGVPVRLTRLVARPVGADPRDDSLKVFFEALQPTEDTGVTAAGLLSYTSPLLWRHDDPAVPFSDFVPEWFALQEDLEDVVTLLCGPFYAPSMYSEHRYASYFQAAEALAQRYYRGPQRSKEQHRQRVAKVCQVLEAQRWDPEDVAWARGILGQRNDKPQRQLLGQLLTDAFAVGTALEELPGNFVKKAVAARVGVSHGGAEPIPVAQRHWLGQAMLWLVRFHLLVEAGLPPEAMADKIVGTARFESVRQQLEELR